MNLDDSREQTARIPDAPEPASSETIAPDATAADSLHIEVHENPTASEVSTGLEPNTSATPSRSEEETPFLPSLTGAGSYPDPTFWPLPPAERHVRIPHMGHLALLGAIVLMALVCDGLLSLPKVQDAPYAE
jgi:hypothetical protein